MIQEEVRYQFLRPAEIVVRREAFPAAYIPIGNIEWHGPQNPLGADTLQAEGLSVMAARLGGGLVLPPLYYGENRSQVLQETKEAYREKIAKEMQLEPKNFLPEFFPFSAAEQARNYQVLLIHILAQAETLGFKAAVLVAGHYPLIDSARAAVLEYNLRVLHQRPNNGMLSWATMDVPLCAEKYPDGGDHGCCWETSHLMHLYPECVDLDTLPGDEKELIPGLDGKYPPQTSTAEFGRETLTFAAEQLVKEVTHRLLHREAYARCGHWLDEGLWR